jgi:hypothetical protein
MLGPLAALTRPRNHIPGKCVENAARQLSDVKCLRGECLLHPSNDKGRLNLESFSHQPQSCDRRGVLAPFDERDVGTMPAADQRKGLLGKSRLQAKVPDDPSECHLKVDRGHDRHPDGLQTKALQHMLCTFQLRGRRCNSL